MPNAFATAADVTRFLTGLRAGDRPRDDERMTLLYEALHQEARRCARGRRADDWQPTELVHEVYAVLFGAGDADAKRWHDRQHFLRAASRSMRHLLIDRARHNTRQKRGGGAQQFQDVVLVGRIPISAYALAQLNEGLDRLRSIDADLAAACELYLVCGWTLAEIAEAQARSISMVHDDLKVGRALLAQHVDGVGLAGA